jgi:hypothetical protein
MGRVNRLCRLAIPAAAISLAAIGAIAGPARSAPPPAPSVVTSFTVAGYLNGVAATSSSNAWAVGGTPGGKTLILHWNGTRWSQVTSPKPLNGALGGVAAVSADNVWAVGSIPAASNALRTLVMHWNGKRWSVQASAPVLVGWLNTVAASGNSTWAVGGFVESDAPVILHGIGNRWYVVPSSVSAPFQLYGVAATGASTAWADGEALPSGNAVRPVLLRWNGDVWKSVAIPLAGSNTGLLGIAASPAGAVWAVGAGYNRDQDPVAAISMLWNGKAWRKVPVGALPSRSALDAVTFVPGGTAWAVGYDGMGNSVSSLGKALLLRWTGHVWTPVANPDGGTLSGLDAVAAISVSNAWAVGFKEAGDQTTETLILHWNGKTWS